MNRLMIFVDDLNMPQKEKYGAQPPLELLRQIIDSGGFYNTKDNTWLKIIKTLFVGAMGVPGGGRTLPSMRLLRHFNLIHVPPFSKENLTKIFSQILNWGFVEHNEVWQRAIPTIVELTISVY